MILLCSVVLWVCHQYMINGSNALTHTAHMCFNGLGDWLVSLALSTLPWNGWVHLTGVKSKQIIAWANHELFSSKYVRRRNTSITQGQTVELRLIQNFYFVLERPFNCPRASGTTQWVRRVNDHQNAFKFTHHITTTKRSTTELYTDLWGIVYTLNHTGATSVT